MSTPSSVPGLPGWLFAYCLLNLLFFLSVQPYRIAGDELLANGDFSRGLEAWEVSGDRESVSLSDGLLTLTHLAVTSTTLAQCWQALGLPQSLLLSAEVEGRNANQALAEAQQLLSGEKIPAGIRLSYTGESEDQEEASEFLSGAFSWLSFSSRWC